jgi:hypothetical protein
MRQVGHLPELTALAYWLLQLEQFQVPVSAHTVSALLRHCTCVYSCSSKYLSLHILFRHCYDLAPLYILAYSIAETVHRILIKLGCKCWRI